MRATDHGILPSLRYFSAFLRHENAIPETSCDPRLKVMWLRLGHIGNFDALKMQFCRVSYLVSSKNLYRILATGKCDCSSGMTARPIGIRHRQSLFSVFWWSENEILQGSWNSWLGNIGFSLSIFSSFWRPEILQSRHLASCEPLLDILAT